MNIVYTQEAKATIYEVSDFIDSINSEGAGEKWVARLSEAVKEYALPNVQYALCKDNYLASLGLSCINFNDWIIAFKIEEDSFAVCEIIRGSILM